MKRVLSIVMVVLIVLSTISMFAPQAKAIVAAIFQDDFEAYTTDSFPSAGGWELVWNGRGTEYQIVTDVVSYSPIKSLQLWGQPSWSANVQRKFTSSAERIGYEVYVRTDSNTGTGHNIASVCFWDLAGLTWGKRFADTWFGQDGEIYTRAVSESPFIPLGLTYEADRWYKVRVVVDRTAETYDVWIEDVLVAEDVGIWDTNEIEAIMLQSGHAGVKAYFDDVKIFEGAAIVQPYGPTASFTTSPTTANICENIKFDASSSTPGWNGTHTMPITEYRWDFGDGNTTTTTTPIIYHSYATSGNHYMTLTVYAPSATPETDTITHKVTVVSIPVGGYSIPINAHTTATPLTSYFLIAAILASIFITIRRKKRRKNA